jgi:hypothetical protein
MNMDIFISNSDIHSIHTRQGLDLHYPAYKLTKVQKGVSFTGIRIFNNLPCSIKILSNDVNKFKYSLKKSQFLQIIHIDTMIIWCFFCVLLTVSFHDMTCPIAVY